jgi:methylated-DNA-[protein]-cysteine S-methyltransferase
MGERGLKQLAMKTATDMRSASAAEAVREAAAAQGLVDVGFETLDTPIGSLLIAVTPRGLVRIAFEEEDRDEVFEVLARAISPRVLPSARLTGAARRELDEYFAGTRQRFELRVDRRLMRPSAKDVLGATAHVGFGHLATYGQIAERVGRPKAARAVGAALGSNPVPIVIPCHRIVGADGSLTGYAGGLERKRALLELEGSIER